MSSKLDYFAKCDYESRKALHFNAPLDEKDLKFKHKAIPIAATALIKGVFGSCRNLCIGYEENVESRQLQGLASIACFWHCNILMITGNYFGYTARVLISEHSDGELIAQACLRTGVSTIRGSTTRGGGRAVIALRKALLEGNDIVVTPDGPKGPAKEFQLGALYLAAKTQTPIIPIGAYGSNMIEFNSWDRFRLPKPFSKNVVRWGEAIHIPKDAMDNAEEWQKLIASKMQEEEDKCRKDVTRVLVGIPRGIYAKRR